MEEYKKPANASESLSKRDKRRQQIASRLNKLEITFDNDRDNFYRASLHNLQTSLATLQQGTNEEFLRRKQDLEEIRDYELTRLRLWEEYQVKRIETEYNEDIAKANQNYERMIKLIKEKLYDKLEKQVKQLKDDKLLLNLVNANSWKGVNGNTGAQMSAAQVVLSQNERRSLRKREASSRFTSGEIDDLSDGGIDGGMISGGERGNGKSTLGNGSGHNSGYFSANGGYSSASSKRRRHYTTRYSSNDESSGFGSTASRNVHGHTNLNGTGSDNDSNLSDKDYDTINNLIMSNEEGFTMSFFEKPKAKQNTRGSHKQFNGLQGLKTEELNDDLQLLRKAVKKDK